ncbi:STAS domain-containing protein [Kitasatospora sp. NPDC096147]|uniref:STAS domain-containing protein n=1 Tax=Kitasatospora sp. NPDC096147 TaxID=3364093 RepID=UPI0037FCF7C2
MHADHDDPPAPGQGLSPDGEPPVLLEADGSRTLVCRLAGDLDIESLTPAQHLLEEALTRAPRLLVIDLEQVRFCDSAGLNLLLKTRASALKADIELRLATAAVPVLRLLEITGARMVFTLYPSTAAALADPVDAP